MKFKIIALLITFFSLDPLQGQTLPAVSPLASTMQRIGITDITITYSRPSANGREIWGKLVPYGYTSFNMLPDMSGPGERDAPWRTGSNNAPFIELTHDVTINGTTIKQGKYALFVVPFQDGSAELVISKPWNQFGSFLYQSSNDVARVKGTMETLDHHQEQMLFEFKQVTTRSAQLALVWADRQAVFTVNVNTPKIVGEQLIADSYNSRNGTPNWRFGASVYLMNNRIHLDMAEGWVNWVRGINGWNNFPTLTTYANLLAMNGKTEAAQKALDLAFEQAQGAGVGTLNFYGNQVLTLELPDFAVRTYESILKLFPSNEWTAYNGLANAYSMKGDFEKAIDQLERAKEFIPEGTDPNTINDKITKLKRGEDIN